VEASKYASVPAGKVIDQRAIFQQQRVTNGAPPYGPLCALYLCCKTTETVTTNSFSTALAEDGYSLEYQFNQNNVFSLNLYESTVLLESGITMLFSGNNQFASLRMVVTDEGTQDKIEVYQENGADHIAAVGSGNWSLLHTEIVTNASPRYRPWGVTAADRNGWAYKNYAGGFNYGSGESTIARYSIDVSDV
jgi:hypothetical protein